MDEARHAALNWETLLALGPDDRVWDLYDEAQRRGIDKDPLLLHASFYAERLGCDSSALGDAYLMLRPHYEQMDEQIQIIGQDSALWPERLLPGPYCPRFLYLEGNASLLDRPMALVIGTRTPTQEGRRQATKSVDSLARAGFAIAAGLNDGIEATALKHALENGLAPIAFIATAHTTYYPLSQLDLVRQMSASALVVSRHGPAAKSEKVNLLLRNRLMASAAHVLLIAEDRDGGTAVRQATWAVGQGKPLVIYSSSADDVRLSWPARFVSLPQTKVIKRPQDLGRVARRLAGLGTGKSRGDGSAQSQLDLF